MTEQSRLECLVVLRATSHPLMRVHVCFIPAGKLARPQRQLTSPEGRCTFSIDGATCGRLRVHDRVGKVLTEAPWSDEGGPGPVRLVVDDSAFAGADVFTQPRGRGLLPDSTWQPIRTAIAVAERRGLGSSLTARLDALTCGVPPIFRDPELLDLARGVLAGHADALEAMLDRLDDWALWSHRQGAPTPRSANVAKLARQMHKTLATPVGGSRRTSLVSRQDLFTLAVATVRASANPRERTRHLLALDHQLSALDSIHRVAQGAHLALTGGPEELGRFVRILDFRGGGCGSGGLGIPWPGFPLPGDPWGPTPEPGEPIPESGGFPRPGSVPERADMWDCLAEALGGSGDPFPELTQYTITSIEPADACPPTEIVIRGENLRHGDHTGQVVFSGPSGSRIIADATYWSDSEIRVPVPAGARCGPIELEIPEARYFVAACGEVELFVGPTRPFRFEGGDTIITSLSLAGDERCYDAGAEVTVSWSSCNATSAELATEPDGERWAVPARGSMRVPLPRPTETRRVRIRLVITGPCGDDAASLSVTVDRDPASLAPVPIARLDFDNWHGNRRAPRMPTVFPTTLDETVAAIVQAESRGDRIGIVGSAWSYSSCVLSGADSATPTDVLVRTEALTGIVGEGPTDWAAAFVRTFVSPGPEWSRTLAGELPNIVQIEGVLRSDASSILSDGELRRFAGATATGGIPPADPSVAPLPLARRLVHVRAGTKLSHLSWLLDNIAPAPLAMATLGGSNGQSIAGAINTGTHGTNCTLPPIPDFVRAIHLVGPGGTQWWIEPASAPITDRVRMAELQRARGDDAPALSPCLRVVYNDALFDAALVSAGVAGVVYSYVLEAAPKHKLRSETTATTWAAARRIIDDEVLGGTPPFFLELVVRPALTRFDPARRVRVTRRFPVPLSTPNEDHMAVAEGLRWAMLGQLATLVPALLPLAVAGYVGRLGLEMFATPWRAAALGAEIEFMNRSLARAIETAAALGRGDSPDPVLVRMAVDLIDLIWVLCDKAFFGDQPIVGPMHEAVVASERPEGHQVGDSFFIYNKQVDEVPMSHGAFERLIESYEYVMQPDQVVAFADAVLDLAESSRRSLIATVNIRFTQRTRASIGMQQHALSGYVEIWTVAGLEGNTDFHRRVELLAAEREVKPHWGHYHRRYEGGRTRDFSEDYTRSAEWSGAMETLSAESPGSTSFETGFASERGLL